MSVRLIRDAEVSAALDIGAAIDAVAAAVTQAARAHAPRSRTRIDLPGGWLRVMTGTLPEDDVFGYKAFHLIGTGDIRYLCALYRLSTGEPLALLDADQITAVRTSATAAAAARAYWGSAPIRVAVVGSGILARGGVRALVAACAVEDVRVFSPRVERRARLAEWLGRELGIAAVAVDSPRAATAEADMLLCATHTRGAVAVDAGGTGDVRYISSIGSTLPSQRELDADVFATVARMVVDTPDVMDESGDVLAAQEAGTLGDLDVLELAEHLERGPSLALRTLYKSIGSVEQDLGLALAIHRRCEQLDIGEMIEPVELGRRAVLPTFGRERV